MGMYNWKCLRLQKLNDFSCWKWNRLKSLRTISSDNNAMHSPAFSAYTCNTICSAHIKIEQSKWWMRCRETVKLNVVISLLFISSILISKQYWLELQQFAALQSHFSLFRFVWVCKLRVQSKVSRNSAIAHRIAFVGESWAMASGAIEQWIVAHEEKPNTETESEHREEKN